MKNCRFCTIIKTRPKDEQLIYENENYIVLTDKYRRTSAGPICLVIPKKHRRNILELNETESAALTPTMNLIIQALQRAYHCKGFRLWSAINKEAGQSVFHCHFHIVPCNSFKDRLLANFPGVYDLKQRIVGKRELSKSVNYQLAQKIRDEINAVSKPSKTWL